MNEASLKNHDSVSCLQCVWLDFTPITFPQLLFGRVSLRHHGKTSRFGFWRLGSRLVEAGMSLFLKSAERPEIYQHRELTFQKVPVLMFAEGVWTRLEPATVGSTQPLAAGCHSSDLGRCLMWGNTTAKPPWFTSAANQPPAPPLTCDSA